MSLYPNPFRGGPRGDCYGGNHYCVKHGQSLAECENDVLRERIRTLEADLQVADGRTAYQQRRAEQAEAEVERLEAVLDSAKQVIREQDEDLARVRDLEREAEVERLREQRDARTEAHAAAEARVRELEARLETQK